VVDKKVAASSLPFGQRTCLSSRNYEESGQGWEWMARKVVKENKTETNDGN